MTEADDRIRQARDRYERSYKPTNQQPFPISLTDAEALFAAVDERDVLRKRVAELETSLHQSKTE